MRPANSFPSSRWRMMCGRAFALAAVLCLLLTASVVAADDDDPVIPPGQEELIANMLGKGIALNLCTLVRGDAEYSVIKATYDCLVGGEVALELGHPRNAMATSAQTGQFAITIQSGSPPRSFQNALASRVRSQEGNFQWSWPERDAATEDDDTDDDGAE